MGQVAVGVGEVGLELERGAVALDGLGDVARVLVHRGQVGVGVGEGRVDLRGIFFKKQPKCQFPKTLLRAGKKYTAVAIKSHCSQWLHEMRNHSLLSLLLNGKANNNVHFPAFIPTCNFKFESELYTCIALV